MAEPSSPARVRTSEEVDILRLRALPGIASLPRSGVLPARGPENRKPSLSSTSDPSSPCSSPDGSASATCTARSCLTRRHGTGGAPAAAGVILSGGPASVYETGRPLPAWVFEPGLPVLGICYGMQVLAHAARRPVAPSGKREYGHAIVHQGDADAPLFAGLPTSMPVWMSHGDRVTRDAAGIPVAGPLGQFARRRNGQRRRA